jgi:hypothetical protein
MELFRVEADAESIRLRQFLLLLCQRRPIISYPSYPTLKCKPVHRAGETLPSTKSTYEICVDPVRSQCMTEKPGVRPELAQPSQPVDSIYIPVLASFPYIVDRTLTNRNSMGGSSCLAFPYIAGPFSLVSKIMMTVMPLSSSVPSRTP